MPRSLCISLAFSCCLPWFAPPCPFSALLGAKGYWSLQTALLESSHPQASDWTQQKGDPVRRLVEGTREVRRFPRSLQPGCGVIALFCSWLGWRSPLWLQLLLGLGTLAHPFASPFQGGNCPAWQSVSSLPLCVIFFFKRVYRCPLSLPGLSCQDSETSSCLNFHLPSNTWYSPTLLCFFSLSLIKLAVYAL